MQKILITGGTGLIGTHFLRELNQTDEVYAITRSTFLKGAKLLNIDLSQSWSSSDLPRDIDVIIHLAQSEYYREFPQKAENVFTVNTLSTAKLLNYAQEIGVKKFILASTGGVYGVGPARFSEDQAILAKGELGYYIGSRLCSEILSECYEKWMDIITLRFFFVFGEGQRPNMLIPRLIETVRNDLPIKLKGENGLSINPIHVSDAVNVLNKAISVAGSHKVNIAGNSILNLRQIGNIIGDVLGKKVFFEIEESNENQDIVGDISLMKSLLCRPKVDFEQAIRDYIIKL